MQLMLKKIKNSSTLLLVSVFLFFGLNTGCDSLDRDLDTQKTVSDGLFLLNRPPVDGATLRVYGISVAKVKKSEIWLGSLSYEADGDADFVMFKACHEQGTCFEGKSALNRVEMPPFNSGVIQITAKACVDGGRSTSGTPCGPEQTGEFLQPGNANTASAELLAVRAQKMEALKAYGVRVKAVIETYQRDSLQCQANEGKADEFFAKKQMLSVFVSLGESLIGTAISKIPDDEAAVARSGPTAVTKADMGPVKKGVADSANRLKNNTAYAEVTAGAFASVGLFQVSNVSAIQSLSQSVFDIFNVDEALVPNCLADRKATTEMNGLKREIEKLKSEVATIDNRLASTNGLGGTY